MNTLDQHVSTLKPEFDPRDPESLRARFDLAFERVLGLGSQLSMGTLDFASVESQAIDIIRDASCDAHAHLLSMLDTQRPDAIVDGDETFEPARRGFETYTCLDGPVRLERWVFASTTSTRTIVPLERRVGLIEGEYTPAAARVLMMTNAEQDYRAAQRLRDAARLLGRSKSSAQRDINALTPVLDDLDDHLEAARLATLACEPEATSLTVSVDRTGLPFEEGAPTQAGAAQDGRAKEAL